MDVTMTKLNYSSVFYFVTTISLKKDGSSDCDDALKGIDSIWEGQRPNDSEIPTLTFIKYAIKSYIQITRTACIMPWITPLSKKSN